MTNTNATTAATALDRMFDGARITAELTLLQIEMDSIHDVTTAEQRRSLVRQLRYQISLIEDKVKALAR